MRKILLTIVSLYCVCHLNAQSIWSLRATPTQVRNAFNNNFSYVYTNKADKSNPVIIGILKVSSGSTVTDTIPKFSQVRDYVSAHGGGVAISTVRSEISDTVNSLRTNATQLEDVAVMLNDSTVRKLYATRKYARDNGGSAASWLDSLSVLSSAPENGNIYINSGDKKIHYLAGGYWHRLAILDSTAATSSLLTGLLLYHNYEESSGTIADLSGNSRTATTLNVTYGQTGSIGNCLQYNGTTSKTYITSYPAPTSAFTFAFRLKTNSTASGVLLECFDESTALSGLEIQYYSGTLTIMLGNGTTLSEEYVLTGTWNDDAWHKFIFTYDGTNILAYVDNVNKLTDTFTGSIDYTNVPGLVLMTNYSESYDIAGYFDEFGVWNRVITSDERTVVNGTTSYPW